MQVMLAVPVEGLECNGVNNASAKSIGSVFWFFSIIVLLTAGATLFLLCTIPLFAIISQLSWGFRHRDKKHRTKGLSRRI